ncbi:MAG TPA: PEPxxWA-CTERM sorting domain-containing protein [Sphingomonas sp.]|uniref:PEPxxWA-CTERM sorting domain-containing protein n=1 Tax=Sphingomonas sp. TaxID=28214 RepID=UPI002B60436F|nr:PEPxxWA-CTERM sorting domain-containing protein [Sphingomonas sp.]HMI18034.1 PEPxxWA-CTERM sorting domain-containing protein [Sphingomonas sp.]
MRSFFLAGGLLVSLGVAITLAQPAQADPVLDRDTTNNDSIRHDFFGEVPGWYGPLNQSVFTTVVAGTSGLLSELDLWLAPDSTSDAGQLELLVFAGGRQDGVPAGDYTGAVYTQIFDVANLPPTPDLATKFNLSSAGFVVTAGETFSFQLRAVGEGLPLAAALANDDQTFSYASTYIAGAIGFGYDDDRLNLPIQFRDYITPPGSGHGNDQSGPAPEPATWAMMLGGFGAVGAAMRRQAGRRQRA